MVLGSVSGQVAANREKQLQEMEAAGSAGARLSLTTAPPGYHAPAQPGGRSGAVVAGPGHST